MDISLMELNNIYEPTYKELLRDVLENGNLQPVRDNNWAWSMFGKSLSFKTGLDCFPLLTSKKMYFKNVKFELAWILKGMTNVVYLKNNGVTIWDKWADESGEIGDTYGAQLRRFNGVDQLTTTLAELRKFKYSRQLVISLWNPVAISQGNIKPCYHAFQLVVIGETLNIIVSQRSADLFIGLPYDMAVFTLFLRLVSKHMGLGCGETQINIGNAHIYKEHKEPVLEYLENDMYKLPDLNNGNEKPITSFDVGNTYLKGYKSKGFIHGKIII